MASASFPGAGGIASAATGAASSAATNRAILIRIKNPAELARSQGAIAALAQTLAPATIEAKIYSTVRDQLAAGFKEKGVDADVIVTDVPVSSWKPPSKSMPIGMDIMIGLGGLGVAGVAWWLFSSHLRNKKESK